MFKIIVRSGPADCPQRTIPSGTTWADCLYLVLLTWRDCILLYFQFFLFFLKFVEFSNWYIVFVDLCNIPSHVFAVRHFLWSSKQLLVSFSLLELFLSKDINYCPDEDEYRGYHIRLYHFVIGWHTLKCSIRSVGFDHIRAQHLVLGMTTVDCNTFIWFYMWSIAV